MSSALTLSSPARFARTNNYWHYQPRIRAGFCTLERPDRCLKDRVHLTLRPWRSQERKARDRESFLRNLANQPSSPRPRLLPQRFRGSSRTTQTLGQATAEAASEIWFDASPGKDSA